MKKIIPIISLISAGVLLTGCSNTPTKLSPNELLDNINNFQTCVDNYTKNESESISKIALNKYELTVSTPINATLVNTDEKDANSEINESKIDENKSTIKDKNNIKIANEKNKNFQESYKKVENISSDIDKTNKNFVNKSIDDKSNYKDLNNNLLDNNTVDNNNEKTITPIENKTLENLSENREIKKQNISNLLRENNENRNNLNMTTDTISDTADTSNETIDDVSDNEKISTLYYLSDDISESCDEFCKLKENIVNAILETQNLITKIQSKEIELSAEQKIFISEQSEQLKNLSRRLSNITRELSLNLVDLSNIVNSNDNLDNLSLKYLIVLDNLVNGNDLLENGLQSLNMINNLFNMNSNTTSNNKGRILYGFRRNNEQPIIKDYIINEDGQLEENNNNNDENNNMNSDESISNNDNDNSNTIKDETVNNNTNNNINQLNSKADTKNNTEINKNVNKTTKNNIDSYKNKKFNSNIDTYGNNYKNIDTFYNTALLDNEFMYGRNGNPYANNYMNNNPNIMNYNNSMNNLMQNENYENNNNQNTTQGVNQNENTQNIENNDKKDNTKKTKKLTKNIDTYKDENTPSLKAKLNKFKQSVTNFFAKFSNPKKEGHYENPIHKYNKIDNNEKIK